VVTGLYTLLLPLVGFAALGSSRYLVVTADSATAAIFAGGALDLAPAASLTVLLLLRDESAFSFTAMLPHQFEKRPDNRSFVLR
jgi:MFS superfamily sulfate permease-like transporter